MIIIRKVLNIMPYDITKRFHLLIYYFRLLKKQKIYKKSFTKAFDYYTARSWLEFKENAHNVLSNRIYMFSINEMLFKNQFLKRRNSSKTKFTHLCH